MGDQAEQVQIEELHQLVAGDAFDGPAQARAGVIDQDIHRAEALLGFIHGESYRFGVGHIQADGRNA